MRNLPFAMSIMFLTATMFTAPAVAGVCGGPTAALCADNEWCDFPDDDPCGRNGSIGTCKPRPEICTKEFIPVCGCDGMFYSNACMAHMGGADVDFIGFCGDGPPKQ